MLKPILFSAARLGRFVALFLTLTFSASLRAQNQINQFSSYNPRVMPESNEGSDAIARFMAPPGLKIDLIAAEPHLANPVSFCFDEKGRIYVTETFRLGAGVKDIRNIMPWLDDELASRSVDDRLGYMKARLGAAFPDSEKESERVKLLQDRDGDGVIDYSTVFAENFTTALDGIGAGVLAHKGNVYFTDIPNLWLLRDTNGDGRADFRKSLQYGFGVRIGYLGHDLHGLKIGPDGKLYFTIGDRGSSVHTDGKWIGHPDRGDVFRCNLDGSDLEVFASGLRNPQELAFDQYGNLFTGDNNSDGGDRARWVYLVEGGDSGWRVGYQFMENPYRRGPFNAEQIWYPAFDGQAAYHLPPITNISAGPSGVAYYPGSGMPEKYSEHFFLADFRGSPQSEVHTFRMKPKGASFEVVNAERFTSGFLVTDVDFGVDGGLYASDWVATWGKTGKGRIYRFHDTNIDHSPIVLETKRLIAEGMDKRSVRELTRLLGHADMRVRQEAQFALADKGTASIKTFAGVAAKNDSQLARLHAIWGLGQIATRFKTISPQREGWTAVEPLLRLLSDKDAEVRAQAAKVLGEHRIAEAFQPLLALLHDDNARVRFFAAMSLGKLGRSEAIGPVLTMLRENADQDRYLRHAGVMALTWIDDADALVAAANDPSASVRMGVLLALRRLQRPEIAQFLNDSDPLLVIEAARAINDEPINGAMIPLAATLALPEKTLSLRSDIREPFLRRAINANLHVGTNNTANVLAQFAALNDAPENMRGEAVSVLADWARPSGRDRVVGLWRPIPSPRNPKVAADALRPVIADLLTNAPNSVRTSAITAVERLNIPDADPTLLGMVGNGDLSPSVRVAALRALGALKSPRLGEAVRLSFSSNSDTLRREATRLQSQIQPSDAFGQVLADLDKGSIADKQSALETLATMPGESANDVLSRWMDKLIAGLSPGHGLVSTSAASTDAVPVELQLDVLEAATKRDSPALKERLVKYQTSLPQDDPLAPFRVALYGGDAQAGRKIFTEHQAAACFRCHKMNGEGGEVGPELTGIGAKKDRQYLLESIVLPNKFIAEGFENTLIKTKSGIAYAGTIRGETANDLVIVTQEDGRVTLKKSEIASRDRGLSGMPEGMTNILTKAELRDVIEFLGTSK